MLFLINEELIMKNFYPNGILHILSEAKYSSFFIENYSTFNLFLFL